MATYKYASTAALQALATKVKTLLGGKVDKVEGKGLSANDLTDELLAHLNGAYTHSQAAHAPANAQENVIETVKVNGTALEITEKAVNITTLTEADLAPYAKTADVTKAVADGIAAAGHLKRAVVDALPTVGEADANTIYMVPKEGSPAGQNVHTEYMLIDGAWEIVGDTAPVLTDYAKTADVEAKIAAAIADKVTNDSLATTLAAYVKSADLVEITAAEVEAMFA